MPLRLRESAGAHVIATLQRHERGLRSVSIVGGGFMPLRGADEDDVPQSMRHLSITDATGDGPKPIRQLSGVALTRLSQAAKRRLLAVALEDPRRTALGVRADGGALLLYLSTTLPAGRVVGVLPEWGVGVISPRGRGLAFVSGQGTIGSLTSYGDDRAERDLAAAIEGWIDRGRPGPDRLLVTVGYAGARLRLRSRWR